MDLERSLPSLQHEKQGIQLSTEILPLDNDSFETQERLWNMLVTIIPRTGYTPQKDRQTILLNLGCGSCSDGLVLTSYFGGNTFEVNSENVHLIGIDNEPILINRAKEAYSNYPNFNFFVADVRDLQDLEIPQQADVVLVRNPGPYQRMEKERTGWIQFFQTAIDRVTLNGIVVVTSYLDQDYEKCKSLLSEIEGADILIDEVNPFTLYPPGHFYVNSDRYITIMKKSESTK